MIEEARSAVAVAVNTGLTMLYWRLGKRISDEILKGTRADYGKKILATLSQELTRDYGNGFSYSALTRMAKFADSFPEREIVATLSQQLSWSHFRKLVPLGALERAHQAPKNQLYALRPDCVVPKT